MKTTKCYSREWRDGSPAIAIQYCRGVLSSDRPARVVWESDHRKREQFIRKVAKRKCWAQTLNGYCVEGDECDPCIARRLLKGKS